ncbi:MAG TPA: HDOD domain-containing protein, partial [Gammaproteobacteria bacterium]|nr:HDOD domain-containing protein [Gammaproteobacteria bacterium]
LVNDRSSSVSDIAGLIETDPALTIRLLRLVNSSYYGFDSSIDTVSRAISLIGTCELRDLALATATANSFNRLDKHLPDMRQFQHHSLYTGLCARLLAEQCGQTRTENFFVSGLLHDIGKLLLYLTMPECCNRIHECAMASDAIPYLLEHEELGYSHAEIGGMLAEQWHLPDNLVNAIRHHHEPVHTRRYQLDATIIHVANFIAHSMDPEDSLYATNVTPLDPESWNTLNLQPDVIDTVMEKSGQLFSEMQKALFPQLQAA